MKFSELVQKLGDAASCNSLSFKEDCNPEISGLAAVDEATPGTLTYVEGVNYANRVGKTEASALILPPDEALQAQAQGQGMAWIATSNPRLLFAQTIALFYQPFRPPAEIHPTAVIHPSTELGKEVYIGAHVVIEAGVKIGDGVCIYPNVVIYPEALIGDRTVLHANCTDSRTDSNRRRLHDSQWCRDWFRRFWFCIDTLRLGQNGTIRLYRIRRSS